LNTTTVPQCKKPKTIYRKKCNTKQCVCREETEESNEMINKGPFGFGKEMNVTKELCIFSKLGNQNGQRYTILGWQFEYYFFSIKFAVVAIVGYLLLALFVHK
jgi:hypothetical protein